MTALISSGRKFIESLDRILLDIYRHVSGRYSYHCMKMDGDKLVIDNSECNRCMHCINVMPRALRPGLEKGATISIGAKAPILEGAQFATLVVPFVKVFKDDDYEMLTEYIEKIWDWWMEVRKNRERVSETSLDRKSVV